MRSCVSHNLKKQRRYSSGMSSVTGQVKPTKYPVPILHKNGVSNAITKPWYEREDHINSLDSHRQQFSILRTRDELDRCIPIVCHLRSECTKSQRSLNIHKLTCVLPDGSLNDDPANPRMERGHKFLGQCYCARCPHEICMA